jgi:1-acyl-sn-glycerol-3-phosphate acyltransferase
MRRLLRRSIGMMRVVIHLTRGALTLALIMPRAGPEKRRAIVQRWSQGVLDIFGLALDVKGMPPVRAGERAVVVVGNHVSWVDIYAYLTVADVRFVAKSEVRSWPLIGWFAVNLGTIFVERDRPRDAVRVGHEVRAALAAGEAVCIFPEGTTTDGTVVLPFSAALLSPAVEADALVHPVAIAYRNAAGEACPRVAFTGDATLVASIWTLASGDLTRVELSFLEPIRTEGLDRRAVARRAEDAVRVSLGQAPRAGQVPSPSRNPGTPETPVAA